MSSRTKPSRPRHVTATTRLGGPPYVAAHKPTWLRPAADREDRR